MTTTRTLATTKRRLVGLTGKNAAGKGEVARLLQTQGFEYHSLSDILRLEAQKLNLAPSRENLIRLGQELRQKNGPGALAAMTIPLLKNQDYVIDSIRSPAEIEILRKTGSFLLLGIDASIEVRFERALKRGRNENALTLDEFKKMEDLERSNDPNRQQLDHCLSMVDEMILNDSGLEELKKRITAILKAHYLK